MSKNEDIIEMLDILETSYKGKFLEGLIESKDYLEGSKFYQDFVEFSYYGKQLLTKLKNFSNSNELYESTDSIQEIIDNWK